MPSKKVQYFSRQKSGFRDNKSTETACHTFTENIQQALDKNLHVVGIILDLTEAHDIISHDIFLYTLESCGFRGILNLWFISFLLQHTQFVSLTATDCTDFMLNRYSFSSRVILRGVPQGSILGPILFH